MIRLIKNVLILFVGLLLVISGCLFYSFRIEPYRLKVNQYTITEEGEDFDKIKIVQISDLHIKEDFTYENLEKVVKGINKLNPDFVLFTGDLYDNYAKYRDDQNIISQLQKIEAKYDKIAIWGNRDYGGGAVRQYESIMEQGGFTLLKNENYEVELESGKKVLFTGLDDSMLGQPSLPNSHKNSAYDYAILLTHEPDVINNHDIAEYHMIFSGHSHGGQVSIPFLPALNEKAVAATKLSTQYSGGMYHLNTDDNTKLYVSTGIGTTHISARFGVVPEIAVFQLYLP